MKRIFPNFAGLLCLLACLLAPTSARAWGCKGHQTVALIAGKYLTPEAKQFVGKMLRENPVDPQLTRYCGIMPPSGGLDLLSDASTWPDDIRSARKNGAWHYIDIPRGAARKPLEAYCGTQGCVTSAIAEQLAILKNQKAEPGLRAEALRYLIHLVADLHMPLHATDNNDLGGNCVPVRYFRRGPHAHHNSYTPNLHYIWDVAIPERDMEGAEPPEYAESLIEKFDAQVAAWQRAGIHVVDWAWESHGLAETLAYGKLSPAIPAESPIETHSCTDARNVGERMMQLHISVAAEYQEAAAPVVEERLMQAGVRLAMILNDVVKVSGAAK